MNEKILVALDGSDGSFRALGYAVELVRRCGGTLHMVSIEEIPHHVGTVLPQNDEKEWSDSRYAQVIRAAQKMVQKAGVPFQAHVIVGHETKAVIEFIEMERFDLLVVGFHGHTAYSLHTMGGTCFSLVQHAPCPVLVVK